MSGLFSTDALIVNGGALILLAVASYVIWQEWRDRDPRPLQHHITIALGVGLAAAAIWLAMHSVLASGHAIAGAPTHVGRLNTKVDSKPLPEEKFVDRSFIFTNEE